MMENNIFRSMMLVGAVITLGIFISSFFVAPVIEADDSLKSSYHLVMGEEVGVDTHHENHLTIYEGLRFGIEGKSRGSVRHY